MWDVVCGEGSRGELIDAIGGTPIDEMVCRMEGLTQYSGDMWAWMLVACKRRPALPFWGEVGAREAEDHTMSREVVSE